MFEVLVQLRKSAKEHQDQLDQDFPGWRAPRDADPEAYWTHDARRESFATVGTILESAVLSYVLLRDHLGDSEWWEARFEQLSPANMDSSRKEFAIMTKWFSFHSLTMAVEETIRAIQRSAPTQFVSKRPSIRSVTEAVLRTCDLEQHESFFRLLRRARNTIHTNGIYFPDYDDSEAIEVDGEVFEFEIGEPLAWFTEERHCWFFQKVIQVMDDLVRSEAVATLEAVPRGLTGDTASDNA